MYPLRQREFKLFSKLIYEKSGIRLNDGKSELVRTRLSKRLRKLGIPTFKEYYQLLSNHPRDPEVFNMLDAITTNKTSFFREPQHFNFINKTVLPKLLKEKEKTGDRVFRIWSAGCSTGEEPYSLAITLLEFLENHPGYKIKILGTDISNQALNFAIRGIYEKTRITDISFDLFRKYFLRGENKWRRFYMVKPELSKIVCFKHVNLVNDDFSFPSSFDIILCRNVMIYFDQNTQEKVIEKCHSILNSGQYFFIGHSESLVGIKHRFQYVQPTIYRK